jgi:hypothetical protein
VDGADSMPAVDKKTGTFATPAVDLK